MGDEPKATAEVKIPPSLGTRARGIVKTAVDRTPAKWLTISALTIFLAATAAFGGLDSVTNHPDAIPDVAAGEEHSNELLSITLESAALTSGTIGRYFSPDDGGRLLVLTGVVRENWHEAIGASGVLEKSITVRTSPDAEPLELDSAARIEDDTRIGDLQPDITMPVRLIYQIPAGAFEGQDTLEVVINDTKPYQFQLLSDDLAWDTYVAAAHVTVPLRDLGEDTP